MTPRRLAVKALMHQEQAGYANLVLDAELKKCAPPLDGRDAAFAARIFYTTLERLPLLDYILHQFTKKPVNKLDAPVRAALRAWSTPCCAAPLPPKFARANLPTRWTDWQRTTACPAR